jgi:hypothetical protein
MKVRWLVLIAVVSLVTSAVGYVVYRIAAVSASFTPPEANLAEEASSWSNSFALKLLGKLGYTVRVHVFPYQRDSYSLIVRRYMDEDELETWRQWLGEGKRLILLCRNAAGEGRPRPLASLHPLMRSVATLSVDPSATLEDFPLLPDPVLRETLLGTDDAPLIMREKARSGGEIVYIADNTAFSDRNLVTADNFFFLNNCLVDHFRSPIAFDYSSVSSSSHGSNADWFERSGDGSGVFFLFRGNFLFLFLELLFLGLVFILVFWKRFGPVRDTEQFARRSLLRHLEATGNFFEKTSNPLVVVDVLDRYFLARLRELLRLVSGSRSDIEAEVQRRLPSLDGAPGEGPAAPGASARGADVFSLNLKTDLTARDFHRERIILRLKGVDKHHGKNKNPG